MSWKGIYSTDPGSSQCSLTLQCESGRYQQLLLLHSVQLQAAPLLLWAALVLIDEAAGVPNLGSAVVRGSDHGSPIW